MTVYNELIEKKILSLHAIIAGKREEIDNINMIISGLYEIKQDGDAPVIDQFIGTEMTEERRQVIYDNCMAKAREILESND